MIQLNATQQYVFNFKIKLDDGSIKNASKILSGAKIKEWLIKHPKERDWSAHPIICTKIGGEVKCLIPL